MSLPVTVRLSSEGVNGGYSEKKVNDTDTEDEDVGSVVDMRQLEQYQADGYRVVAKDDRARTLTLMRSDEIKCRGKRPCTNGKQN